MIRIGLAVVTCAMCAFTLHAGDIGLAWDPAAGATGYRVSHGVDTRTTTPYPSDLDIGSPASSPNCPAGAVCYLLSGLPDNLDTCSSVRAYNSVGNSDYSREVCGWPRPILDDVPMDCDPAVDGGALCTVTMNGQNFASTVTVDLYLPGTQTPYPNTMISDVQRVNEFLVTFTLAIDASAAGGAADLVARNPWQVTAGTEVPGDTAATAGTAGGIFPGAVTITPVVLPSSPQNVIPVEG